MRRSASTARQNDRDSYRPTPRPNNSHHSYPGPSYRLPQVDFTFRAEKPSGIEDAPYDSYRPSASNTARRHRDGQQGRYTRDRPGRGGYSSRGRGSRIQLASDRPMMRPGYVGQATQAFFDPESGAKYRDFEDLSDSEEADMSISGDSDADNDAASGEPTKKRVRVQQDNSAEDNSAPKWSNPDPYTALPPSSELQKRKDVVQLIRKARIGALGSKGEAVAEAEDFIGFSSDDSDQDYKVNGAVKASSLQPPRANPPPGAPTGPRLPAKPPPPLVIKDTAPAPAAQPGIAASSSVPSQHMPPPPYPEVGLGARKRTHDDQLKPTHVEPLKKGKKPPMTSIDFIDARWRVDHKHDPRPWTDYLSTLGDSNVMVL